MSASLRVNGANVSAVTLPYGQPVTVTNADTSGVSSQTFTAFYPSYSDGTGPDFVTNWSGWTVNGTVKTATIVQTGSYAAVAFTPDVPGTYVISLEAVSGLTSELDSVVIRVLASVSDQVPPGYNEDKESSPYGFADVVNRILTTSAERRGWVRVYNNSGAAISASRVARVTGTVDYRTIAGNAVPSGSATKPDRIPTIALNDNSVVSKYVWVFDEIPNNTVGWVIDSGYFGADTSGLSAGAVYSTTGGVLTSSETAVTVGTVLSVSATGLVHFSGVHQSNFSLPNLAANQLLFGDGTNIPASSPRVFIDLNSGQELLTLEGTSGTTALEITRQVGGGVNQGGLRLGHAPFASGIIDGFNGSGQNAFKFVGGSAGDPNDNRSWIASRFAIGTLTPPTSPDTLQVAGGATITGGSVSGGTGPGLTLQHSFGVSGISSQNKTTSAWLPLALDGSWVRLNTNDANRLEVTGDGAILFRDGTNAASVAGSGGFRYNASLNRLQWQENGGAWVNLAAFTLRQVIAGAGLTGGGALSADVTLNVAAGDSSIVVNPDSIVVGVISDAQHGQRGGDLLHALATTSSHGFMSLSDKFKLDGLPDPVTFVTQRVLFGNNSTTPTTDPGFTYTDGILDLTSTGTAAVQFNSAGTGGGAVYFANTGYIQQIFNTSAMEFDAPGGLLFKSNGTSRARFTVDGALQFLNASTAAVSTSGTASLRLSGGRLQISENGGAWANLTDGSGLPNLPSGRVLFGDGTSTPATDAEFTYDAALDRLSIIGAGNDIASLIIGNGNANAGILRLGSWTSEVGFDLSDGLAIKGAGASGITFAPGVSETTVVLNLTADRALRFQSANTTETGGTLDPPNGQADLYLRPSGVGGRLATRVHLPGKTPIIKEI